MKKNKKVTSQKIRKITYSMLEKRATNQKKVKEGEKSF